DAFLADKIPQDEIVKRAETGRLDRELWNGLSGLGLMGILADAGEGLNLGLLTLAVAADKLASRGAAAPVVENAVAAWALGEHRAEWASRIMSGETIAALAIGEDGGAWSPAQWRLNGGNLISGEKKNVLFGAEADILVVGLEGGDLGVVEAKAAGVTINRCAAVDLTRPMANVRFEDVAVERLTSTPGKADRLYDALLITSAIDAYGAASRAAEMAVEYAKVREQFGRPIGAFQALKHQLADMTIDIAPTRSLCWYAAHLWDLDSPDASRMASVAKAHVTDVAVKTARMAVEANGGVGYTWTFPLHIFLKRAMADRVMYGLPSTHRARAAQLASW
ncbi:MAG: acyl-CoA dehydrogenase family protein, partial [Hyphomonadaceae bacterium]